VQKTQVSVESDAELKLVACSFVFFSQEIRAIPAAVIGALQIILILAQR
jgi:hypothetical protein